MGHEGERPQGAGDAGKAAQQLVQLAAGPEHELAARGLQAHEPVEHVVRHGAVVGDRMLTISAWEHPDDPRQLIKGGQHADAMKGFFGRELGGGGYTAVFVPERINTMWVRCSECRRMIDSAARQGVCACGAALPPPIAYW